MPNVGKSTLFNALTQTAAAQAANYPFCTIEPNVGEVGVPDDRIIDGVDQRAFFAGEQERSDREGFLYWLGPTLYGVKWRNFKLRLVLQKYLTDPALTLPNPHVINLITDMSYAWLDPRIRYE